VFWNQYKNDDRGDWRPSGNPGAVARGGVNGVNPSGLKYTGYSIGWQTTF